MNNNNLCRHCEYQPLQDSPHAHMKQICTLEQGVISRCELCGTSWMLGSHQRWLMLREGQGETKTAAAS